MFFGESTSDSSSSLPSNIVFENGDNFHFDKANPDTTQNYSCLPKKGQIKQRETLAGINKLKS